jgi:hypothetical protein
MVYIRARGYYLGRCGELDGRSLNILPSGDRLLKSRFSHCVYVDVSTEDNGQLFVFVMFKLVKCLSCSAFIRGLIVTWASSVC